MTDFRPAFDANGRLIAPAVDIPELCAKSGVELLDLLRAGATSSVEIVTAALDQVDALNPTFNAIVSLRPREAVLADARAADDARASGDGGTLLGLPIAFKDMQPTKGLRTTFGSPLFADFVPDEDSLTVARIRAAGAVVIGKTNTPEFALGSHTYNTVFGRTLNAFDPSKSAGGSSGGAAVALATRMLSIADGSDFGGSLRNPGAYNNVFGLRPSFGRVPNVPSKDGFFAQFSSDGPMARTVPDLALMLSVMSGYDPRSPLALDLDFARELPSRAQGARIGWLGDLGGRLPMESGVLEICQAALETMERQGWRVEPVAFDIDFAELWRSFVVLRQFSALASHGAYRSNPVSWAKLKPELQWELEQASKLTADDVSIAATTRSKWRDTAFEALQSYDALALPSAQVFPFPSEWDWPTEIAGHTMDSYHRWLEVATPASLTAFPAINVPVGFGPSGLPMGMQLLGRPRGDAELLALAREYEILAPRTARPIEA